MKKFFSCVNLETDDLLYKFSGNEMTKMKKLLSFLVMLAVFLSFGVQSHIQASSADAPVVGIAWRADVDS